MTRLGVFRLPMFLSLMFAALAAASPLVFAQTETDALNFPKGTLERTKVHGASLEGNLEGDSPDRDVVVYLPPNYAKEKTRRYPVIYFLHGYTVGAEMYVKMLGLQDAMDSAIAGGVSKMILVLPDAFTVYSGSMYSNSPTTGDWEAHISHDLIAYIDSHYRTIADRSSRGLAGHSMGGYGTIRIGMKHPEAFGALYAMSSCCLMNDPAQGQGASVCFIQIHQDGCARDARWLEGLSEYCKLVQRGNGHVGETLMLVRDGPGVDALGSRIGRPRPCASRAGRRTGRCGPDDGAD
jgi:enterochelin esterase-like enzyme